MPNKTIDVTTGITGVEHFFNNAGPSKAQKHYMIDPLQRINVTHIATLIAQERYFVLHAPRQTGKTTCLLALMEHLNQQGHYRALYTNCLLYTSPSPRDLSTSRMPSSA